MQELRDEVKVGLAEDPGWAQLAMDSIDEFCGVYDTILESASDRKFVKEYVDSVLSSDDEALIKLRNLGNLLTQVRPGPWGTFRLQELTGSLNEAATKLYDRIRGLLDTDYKPLIDSVPGVVNWIMAHPDIMRKVLIGLILVKNNKSPSFLLWEMYNTINYFVIGELSSIHAMEYIRRLSSDMAKEKTDRSFLIRLISEFDSMKGECLSSVARMLRITYFEAAKSGMKKVYNRVADFAKQFLVHKVLQCPKAIDQIIHTFTRPSDDVDGAISHAIWNAEAELGFPSSQSLLQYWLGI